MLKMNYKYEQWAITQVWQNSVKDKWEKDGSVLLAVGRALRLSTSTVNSFDVATEDWKQLSLEEKDNKIQAEKEWIHGHLTPKQGKILYLDAIWDNPYPQPFHDDKDFETKGMLFNLLLIV